MASFRALETEEQWQALKGSSEAVLILKHSATCGISLHAYSRVEEGLQSGVIDRDVQLLIIQESRPLSTQIAEETGVTHQSPQLILMQGGKALYNASHQAIAAEAIAAELTKL